MNNNKIGWIFTILHLKMRPSKLQLHLLLIHGFFLRYKVGCCIGFSIKKSCRYCQILDLKMLGFGSQNSKNMCAKVRIFYQKQLLEKAQTMLHHRSHGAGPTPVLLRALLGTILTWQYFNINLHNLHLLVSTVGAELGWSLIMADLVDRSATNKEQTARNTPIIDGIMGMVSINSR